MNQSDRLQLLAEKKFLQERLLKTPDNARLMKRTTESRLQTIEEQLASPNDEREPAKVNLTFNGRPVIGSHGIFAEFGMQAVSRFTEAVAAVAASISGPLAASGPIPNRGQNQLLITNTAIGSFGFQLEEYRAGQLALEENSPISRALEWTQNLLQSTVGTDDQLADSAAETDPRALEKVRSFLQLLSENEAVAALEFKGSTFRFANIQQVQTSVARLSQDNLHESELTIRGRFAGYLPSRWTFDFVSDENGELITGKVPSSIQNAERINDYLKQPVTIRVMRTQVGNGKPRFRLLELPTWPNLLGAE
jgi:hypothetical protein